MRGTGGGPSVEVRGLTKDYGGGRGVFDVSFAVGPGEVLGFLGPNGAGKTVTMRHLMGFVRPQAGEARICGLPCFERRPEVQRHVGYLPGEAVCIQEMTVASFLDLMARMRGLSDRMRMRELMGTFELDGRARIRSLSKGNRQKVSIVSAFMGSPDVLLLDEPTSGLDPLMQERFIELVQAERDRGAAALLSSHVFEEVERTCDHVAFIRAGRIAAVRSLEEVRFERGRSFEVSFSSVSERDRWAAACGLPGVEPRGGASALAEGVSDVGALVRSLAAFDVTDLRTREQSLEETFISLYEGRDAAVGSDAASRGATGAAPTPARARHLGPERGR